MKSLIALVAVGLILTVVGTARATDVSAPVTFQFDPVNFYNWQAPTDGNRPLNGGAFSLFPVAWADNTGRLNSYDATSGALNTWAADLGAGQGISCFNIWLADQASAPTWGETLVSSGSFVPTGTAPAGWNCIVIGNPWPPEGGSGEFLVEWYTDNPADYASPVNDPGAFSFTFVPTTQVDPNQNYTIWFGGLNGGEDPSSPDFTGITFDGSNPGTAGSYGSGFEATLSLAPVPEPITMAGLMMGIGGLVTYVRRRARK